MIQRFKSAQLLGNVELIPSSNVLGIAAATRDGVAKTMAASAARTRTILLELSTGGRLGSSSAGLN
ncbi:hypothetical protein SOVF_134300 [Spinacia oleracea]|nr:hypothetical protein SOVF_134300 [Spinacia oleracea]